MKKRQLNEKVNKIRTETEDRLGGIDAEIVHMWHEIRRLNREERDARKRLDKAENHLDYVDHRTYVEPSPAPDPDLVELLADLERTYVEPSPVTAEPETGWAVLAVLPAKRVWRSDRGLHSLESEARRSADTIYMSPRLVLPEGRDQNGDMVMFREADVLYHTVSTIIVTGHKWRLPTCAATVPIGIPRVIIESPYAGDIEENLRYLRACMADSLSRGEAPYASHGLYTQPGVLDDDDSCERVLGIEAGLAWGAVATLRAVYTDLGISRGMSMGITRSVTDGVPVEYRTLAGWGIR